MDDAAITRRQRVDAIASVIDSRPTYHHAALVPEAYRTQYPFFLLGIEKPRDDKRADRPYCAPGESGCIAPTFDANHFGVADSSDLNDTRKDIRARLFSDPRSMVLTHLLRARRIGHKLENSEQPGCFIYNVYGATTDLCTRNQKSDVASPGWKRDGWGALDQLRLEMLAAAKAERATHIILLVTGWNTTQYESYLDFQEWMTRLSESLGSRETFRPVFVGISWESAWDAPPWSWIPFISAANKGNDADEIGYGWGNMLLNDVLKPVAQEAGANLVAIGHSYGTRIVFSAHYVRDVLKRSAPVADTPLTIIGMQAAFPLGRFITAAGREHQYISTYKGAARIAITSSALDAATSKVCVGTTYVGGRCGLATLSKYPKPDDTNPYKNVIKLLTTQPNGTPNGLPDSSLVTIYDATPFVNCELGGTSSGAHSDVYDKEMGTFLGAVIRSSSGQ